MPTLDVSGATLHYETQGNGPILILVPGASGTGASLIPFAAHLAEYATVVTFDRRGFSRSTLHDPQPPNRLDADADDVRRLIDHLAPPVATVYGASSGAIVALHSLTRHPDAIACILAFEPPAVTLLPHSQRWLDTFAGTYDLYRQSGPAAALTSFRDTAFPEVDRQLMQRTHQAVTSDDTALANAVHWFEHELRQYPAVHLDTATISEHSARVRLLGGRASHGYPAYESTLALARAIGIEVTETPGGHLGHLVHPGEVAAALQAALACTA